MDEDPTKVVGKEESPVKMEADDGKCVKAVTTEQSEEASAAAAGENGVVSNNMDDNYMP